MKLKEVITDPGERVSHPAVSDAIVLSVLELVANACITNAEIKKALVEPMRGYLGALGEVDLDEPRSTDAGVPQVEDQVQE